MLSDNLEKLTKSYISTKIVISTKLNAENTTSLLESCIQFYRLTNISDIYIKYVTLTNSAKCNLNAINLEMNSWEIDQKENLRNYLNRTNAITKYTYK